MLRPHLRTELKLTNKRRVRTPVRRRFTARKLRRSFNKNDWSHSTDDSDRGRQKPRRGRPASSPKDDPSDAEPSDSPVPEAARQERASGPSLTRTNLKRPRFQKFPIILEDGEPWTTEEMKAFEVLYGDRLFDNTIDTGAPHQANLQLLTTKTFKSYRQAAAGACQGLTAEGVRELLERARKVVEGHGSLVVSNSQLVRLLSYFPTEKGFLEFLNLEGELLVNYFEKTKLYPRRKVYK